MWARWWVIERGGQPRASRSMRGRQGAGELEKREGEDHRRGKHRRNGSNGRSTSDSKATGLPISPQSGSWAGGTRTHD